MPEYIEFDKAPNVDILEDIMEEVRNLMGNFTVSDIEFYMNQRVKEEIDKGNFRTSFITPSNRVAEWECILIKVENRRLNMVPKWTYANEVDINNEPKL